MQGLALGLVLVDGVDDGALERLGGVARGVLHSVSAVKPQCAPQSMPTRMLGVSVFSPAISLARSAVVEKARAAVERAAVANGRLTASRIAIVSVWERTGLRGAAGGGRQWGGEGGSESERGSDTDVHQARWCSRPCTDPRPSLADSLLQAHLPPARSPIHPRTTVHSA